MMYIVADTCGLDVGNLVAGENCDYTMILFLILFIISLSFPHFRLLQMVRRYDRSLSMHDAK